MTAVPPEKSYDALAEAKRLLRTIRGGALATLTPDGTPFSSLVAVATMPDGSPILLLSQLAPHTRHLEADGRCSLLLSEAGKGDVLAHPRLTLVARAAPAGHATEQARGRFLARNPKSKLYADFPDFAFWRLDIAAGHLNGGFARAAAFTAEDLRTDVSDCPDLVDGEAGAVAHMNADHRAAISLYATALAGLPQGDWQISGLDPEGADLQWGDRTGRLPFPRRVTTGGDLRRTLVALADEARQIKP